MLKLACVLQTTLIELMVCEIHSETQQTWANNSSVKCIGYDRWEHQPLDLCFEAKQTQFALQFHHIL